MTGMTTYMACDTLLHRAVGPHKATWRLRYFFGGGNFAKIPKFVYGILFGCARL
jgi:hypothetical protein